MQGSKTEVRHTAQASSTAPQVTSVPPKSEAPDLLADTPSTWAVEPSPKPYPLSSPDGKAQKKRVEATAAAKVRAAATRIERC